MLDAADIIITGMTIAKTEVIIIRVFILKFFVCSGIVSLLIFAILSTQLS